VNQVLSAQQPPPIVVEVIEQPPPARDISIDHVITMFTTAGVLLLAALVGGLIAGAIFVGVRRLQEKAGSAGGADSSHVKLRI
jgi:hypothetical protein